MMSVEKKYIVISLKHGHQGLLCFWRPNSRGYTNNLNEAGRYSEDEIKNHLNYYHDGVDNIAVEEEKLLIDFRQRIVFDTNYLKVKKYRKLAAFRMLSLPSKTALVTDTSKQ